MRHRLTGKNSRVPRPQLHSNKTAKKSFSQMCIQHTCNIIEEANVDSFILHMILTHFNEYTACLILVNKIIFIISHNVHAVIYLWPSFIEYPNYC